MLVDLDRKDIVCLLRGVTPNYEIMDKIPEDLGYYVGGFDDSWHWSIRESSTKHTDEELYEIYLMCKHSFD